jgi:thioredoxin reductase (NADPH)
MADYDVIIIGSGLAGLTAGLFAARYGLSTMVLESNLPGGHLLNIEKIDDFPGFPDGIPGYELCPAVQRQAADQGAEFQRVEVAALQADGRSWQVATAEETHRAKTVILATGSAPKELGVPGEARLLGRGVSHCASCDGPLYRDQSVAVVGDGDSAFQEALTLARHGAHVTILARGERCSAQFAYQKQAEADSQIDVRRHTVVNEILGGDAVSGARVRDLATGNSSEIGISGIFIYVGLSPNTQLLKNLVRLSESGHVATDTSMRTEAPGLYAVGDIRLNSPSQAITSAGEGATAAIAAYQYINETFR